MRVTGIGHTAILSLGITLAVGGCADESLDGGLAAPAPDPSRQSCSIDPALIFTAAPAKDWIPALTNPTFVGRGDPTLDYLRDFDRVVGLVVDDRAYAIPLNILWWHEIVNLDVGGRALAITHCPLTGTSLVFDRGPLDGVEFGVSGLLYLNNLIMYDRSTGESLWPQMLRGARCGARAGTPLRSVAALEVRWDRWQEIHPDTRVVGGDTGFQRSYDIYPYPDYDEPRNEATLFPRRVEDTRRLPKELVLGIPDDEQPLAIPLAELASLGATAAVHPSSQRPDVVVFWDAAGQAAAAYRAWDPDGDRLTITVENGRVVDRETGSTWRFDGLAVAGPLEGVRLVPVAEAYVAFWFAWIDFHPGTRLVEGL